MFFSALYPNKPFDEKKLFLPENQNKLIKYMIKRCCTVITVYRLDSCTIPCPNIYSDYDVKWTILGQQLKYNLSMYELYVILFII